MVNKSYKNEESNKSEKGGMWKGDDAGYLAIHTRIRKRKIKPKNCEICGLPEYYEDLGRLELSDKTGLCLDNNDNFQYIHRSCHIKYDADNKIKHIKLLKNGINKEIIKETSKRNDLVELLKVEALTTKEIAEKLRIPLDHIWTYISQFSRSGKVIKVGKKGRFNMYKAVDYNPTKLLSQLHEIMEKRMNFIEKPSENEIETIKIIEEMIK